MRVLGQPSVLYFRRSQPSSRYQPSRPSSAIFASTSSSVYGVSFSRVAMGSRLLGDGVPLHHSAAVDVECLPGHERRRRRGQVQRRRCDVRGRPPPAERRGVRHRAPEPWVGLLPECRLDPTGAEDVDADRRREGTRETLAEGQDAALDRAEELGVATGHAARDVVPAHVHDRAAAGLLAHDRAGCVRAGDGALEIDGQEKVELAFPVPVGRISGEHVGSGVVDPHVQAPQPLPRLGDERVAARSRAEVGPRDERAAATGCDAVGDRVRTCLALAVRDEHRGSGGRQRLRDRGADAAARAGDDRADGVEPELARLRRVVRRSSYASAPAAKGCLASVAPSTTCWALGSEPIARATDSFVASRFQSKIFLSSAASQWMNTPTMMQRFSTWSCGMIPSLTASTTPRATPACAGPNMCMTWAAPLSVTLLAMIVSGFAGRLGATTARRFVCPSFWLIRALANASPTGPSFGPIRRSM